MIGFEVSKAEVSACCAVSEEVAAAGMYIDLGCTHGGFVASRPLAELQRCCQCALLMIVPPGSSVGTCCGNIGVDR